MAEVMGALRDVQNTVGRGSRRSKVVKDDSTAVGATKAYRKMAVARNAVGYLSGEIGVTKPVAGKEAAGSFTVEIGVTKADAGNKGAGAAGIVSGEIGVVKADSGNKGKTAGSVPNVIGVTKPDAVIKNKKEAVTVVNKTDAAEDKKAAGSVTGEIYTTKAEVGAAGIGVVKEKDWLEFVFPINTPVGSENKAKPGALITKERVPDSFIKELKSRPAYTKLPPLCNAHGGFDRVPETRDRIVAYIAGWNYLVDLQADVLRQVEDEEKPFAEIGVDFTGGMKKYFILPKVEVCAGCAP